ncbi:MarC family protein [Rhodoblastus sp. 17X3]|uniref:MarC family protein n=1 Tax=Rhodoblastus sp. 17X3 TaxID=3047026 RepID=UPI0024B7C710|nr:MarC family protein [Rhodoblastus sp. 17X3]MDI9849038.1 MarC family protein [Rhodoblastus sp. 17X3]
MPLFLATFTTLLAIINPFEALPVYLGFAARLDDKARRSLAFRSCLYALMLMFFFLIFGTLLLKVFGVPLAMVRIAGGIILTRLGFQLFSSPSSVGGAGSGKGESAEQSDAAFVPLAMPIMFGPGAMATILGMTSQVKNSASELTGLVAVSAALVATMGVTYLILASAKQLQQRLGPRGIDAATRIVGFFVAAMGIGMAFDGIIEALQMHGVTSLH